MRFSWESFDGLLSRAKEKIEKIFPVAGERYTLQASNLRWENTGEDIYSDPALHKDYKIKGKTLAARLIGTFKIYDNATKKLVDAESAYPILSIPHLTSKRSFLVNGKEIQIVNQIRLKPGTYTRYTADNNVETFVNAPGGGYRVMLDRVKSVFRLRIGQSTYVHLLPILKGLGIDEDAIKKAWGDDVFAANKAKDNPDDMAKLYAKMRPYYSAPVEKEELNTAVKDFFASKRLDPSITRLTLGTAYKNITPETLLDSSARALKLSQGSIEEDDTENLAYKSIHSTDDFVLEKLDQQIEASTRRIAYMVDRRPKVLEAIPPRMFTEPVMRFFSTSEFSRYSDQNNPLDMLGVDSLVTTMGEGGLKSMHSVTDDLRALHPSHVGVLDPIHTSEAQKIGITNHLTLGARKMGTDLGLTVIDAKTGKRVEKRVVDIEDKVVAFNDQYDFSKGKPRALVHDLKVRSQGKFITTAAAKVDYIFDAPAKMFGIVANAIPFLHNDSPNRALMATRHMEQAVPLKNPDVPSVQARFGAGGYESVLGKLLAPNSPVDGKVTKVKAAEITILGNDKKTYTVQLHQYYPLNSNAFLHEVPIVKVGDLVKKNQTIADSDFTRKGDLAIGRTLRTAFLPYKGQNFEDGFVVSEGAADKLTSVHKHEMRLDLDATITTGLSKLLAYFPATAEGVDRSKFDAAGLLKKGVILNNGELAIPGVRKITVHEEFDYTKLHKSLTNQWQDVSVRWDGDAPAEVIDVVKTRGFISIYVRTEEKLEIGDKISIRHGGKGIVCNILPDKEMYRDEKGNVIDVLFNPASVLGRINPGTLFESAAGKVAEKTGKTFLVDNFTNRDSIGTVQKALKDNGLSDLEGILDPTTNKVTPDVTVGNLHFVKLRHQVSKKLSARGITSYAHDESPAHSKANENPMAIGTMELYSLLAGGGTAFLRDATTLKSTKQDEYWRALQLGLPLPPLKTPFIVDKFVAYMRGAGINLKQEGTALKALPLTDKDIMAQSNGEITSPGVVKANDLSPEDGGLFDKALTGGFAGCFHGSMHVLTREGWVSIKDIVENRMSVLVACHTKDGRVVYRRVVQFWKNRRTTPMLNMTFDLGGSLNGYVRRSTARSVVVTPNHKIAIAPHQYARADEMNGRVVLVPSHELSGLQEQIVLGGLLGDSHLTKKRQSLLQMSHAVDQEAWLRWKSDVLSDWLGKVAYNPATVGHQRKVHYRSYFHTVWTQLRAEWYPDGVKIVPQAVLEKLDRRGLAVWFGDDGTVKTHHGSPYILFCTHGFSLEDVQKLQAMLRSRFGLVSKIPVRAKKYVGRDLGYMLMLDVESSRRCMDLIAPWLTADVARKFKPKLWGTWCSCGQQIPRRTQYCDSCLISEVQRFSARRDFDKNSRFESTTVRKRYGSWSAAVALSKLGISLAADVSTYAPVFGAQLSERESAVPVLRRTRVRVAPESRRQFRSDYVYDIGVEGEHNYVVQGICVSNSYWNHIVLADPIPNPLMDQAITSLLGTPSKPFRKAEFEGLIEGNLFVTKDGKITTEAAGNKTGGEALKFLLSKIDVDKDTLSLRQQVRTLRGAPRDNAVKKLRYLRALKSMNMSPVEAYINTKIPIIPAKMRPIYPNPDGTLNVADPVHGYREVLLVNNQIKDLKKLGVDDKNLGKLRGDLYKAVCGLVGIQEPLTRSENFKGFIQTIKGPQNKYGLFQGRVLKRRQDLTGRSTIIPDPKLGLDEIKLPEDMAFVIYQPFIVNQLRAIGYPPLKARELIEAKDPAARAALEAVMRERPVLFNRAPSLHKFSLMSFKPQLSKGKAIEMNPLVVTGYSCVGRIPILEDGRFRIVDLEDFPHGDAIIGEDSAYSVPESVEVLTYVENGFEWKHPDRYYIHKDLKGVKVTVGKNRKVVVSESHSLYCFDPEKGECRRMPPSEALGKATPRLVECRTSDRILESTVGPDGSYLPLTRDLGWWFGTVIGDGWASFTKDQPKGVCLSGSIGAAVLDRWTELSESIFGKAPGKPVDRVNDEGAWGSARELTINSMAMASWLAPLIGRKAANKHLPEFVWWAPDEFCLGLIAGLMDTDSHIGTSKTGRTNVAFTAKGETLAEQLVWLLSRFGVDANHSKRKNSQGRKHWVVNPSITGFHSLDLALVNPKKRGSLNLLDVWPANDSYRSNVIPVRKDEAEAVLCQYRGTAATKKVGRDGPAFVEYNCLLRAAKFGLIGRVILSAIVIRLGEAKVPPALMARLRSSVKWDRVSAVETDAVQDMYDLRVPGGTYTFVLSNKVTVFDSADFDGDAMQVHVPVSEAAREEAMTKLLPSKNLFSPRDNSVLNAPSKEMLLGVYLMTTPKGDPKPAASLKEVMGLYEHRTIAANTAMTVKGRVICPGQIIFNEALPQEFRKDFESVTKSKLMVIIAEIANKKPAIAGDIISKIKDLGNRYVTEIGYSFGLRDLHFPTVERDKIMADAAVDAKKRGFMAAYGDASKKMQAAVKTKVDNRIVIGGPISGAFGKSDEITQTIASPVAVKDHTGKVIEIPIMRSYAEGMDSGSYWTMIPGSRKGLMDRALSTGDTGTFSKHLLAATVDTVISEMDCGTTEGLTMPVTEPEALDRVIASGPYKGKIFDTKLSRMLKAKGKDTIVVRSPLRCKSHRGMCSKCMGLLENGQFAQVGYHIGALAGQTISEPAMQLTMRCSAGLVHAEYGIIPFSAFFDRSTVLFQEDDFEVATPACDVVDRAGVVKTGLVERHLPHDDMYLVKTRSGAAVLVQGNHPMWVLPCAIRPGSSNRRVQIIGENKYRCTSTFYRDFSANEAELAPEMIVKRARDITMEDAVWVDYRPLLGGSHVPDLDPYLAGFFAAEGCFRVGNGTKKYKGISVATIFSVSSHTPWFKEARKRLEPLLGVEHSEGQRAYTVYGLEYARKIDRVVGYSGEHTAHNKVLRVDVASLAPRWAQEFLEGYIDGDGCVFESSGVTVAKTTSTSWELTSQIIALCKKLGAHPSVSATDDAPSRLLQWRTSFNIEIRFPKGFTPIRSFKLGIVRPMKHTKKAICGFDPVCLVKKLTRWKGYVYDVKTDTEGFMAGPIHNHNSFHTGGSIGSSNVGYPRIKQIMEMPANVRGKAILSMQPGTVKSIAPSAAGGWNVDVDGMNHFVPMEQGLGVKKGQKVEAGQLLSTGGAVTPQDVLAATNDIRKVQDQMIGEIGGIYRQSGINIKRRIFEAAIQPLTNRAEVSDPGDADVEFGINVGDVKSINILDDFNNQLKKKGKRPILFVPTLLSIKTAPSYAEDFIGQMIAERPHQTLKNAPSLAATSNIGPSGHPIATYAFGRFFGDKVEDHKKKTASEVGQEIQDLSTLLVEPEEEKPPEFTEDVNKMIEELRELL